MKKGRIKMVKRAMDKVAVTTLFTVVAFAVSMTTAFGKPPAGEGGDSKKQVKPLKVPDVVEGTAQPTEPVIPPVEVKGPHGVIKADETVHDFGAVWVGPPLTHAFKITNTGDATLDISKVKPSCGCTIAGDYPKKLDPGQTGEFPFTMNSTKLRGVFEKGITINSNDPVTPDLRLRLRGEVKRFVEVVPAAATFGKITSQEVQERIVNITNNMETPLQLTLKPSADNKFKFDLVEKSPGKQFDLHVTATPPFDEGTLHTVLNIGTNVEAQKELLVDVSASVPARLEVQPGTITLSARKPDAPAGADATARVIKFTNYGKTPVKLLEATCDDPTVTLNVTERKPGEAYTVAVQIPPNFEPPATGRTITLKTDDAQKPTITVPIQGAPAPSPTVAERRQVKPAESLVGQPTPAFNLTTIDGKPLNNGTLQNQVTVLDFFAPNCGFCKKQIPRIEPIREKYADKGVRFVNVSEKMGAKEFSKDEVVDLMKGMNFKGELALDHTNEVGPLFKATSYPTMVVIGKTGKVEAVNSGNLADLESRLSGQIEALLAGKPVPADAPVANAPVDKAKTADAPPVPRGRPEDLVGKPAPLISLTTLAGKPLSNGEFGGAPATVLNFFAPNCGFCKKQIPRLEMIRKTYVEKGVRFVNVAETMGKEFSQEETEKILKDLGAQLEVARDPGNKFGPAYFATGFPTMVVVGKSGKVEAVNVGNVADLESRMEGQLDALIAGKPVPSPQTAQAAPNPPQPPAPTPAAAPTPGAAPQPTKPDAEKPGEAPKGQTADTAKPADAPKPAPPQPRRVPEDLVGKPAPAFTLSTLGGKPLSNAELAKAPATVLNFFAPNCGYCKKQIPTVEKVRKTYVEKGVRFVNVAEAMGKEFSQEETEKILKELGAELEVARDSGNQVGGMFNVSGFPTMVVVGKSGKVEAVNIGAIPDLETRLGSQLDALIAGKSVPTELAKAPEAPAPPAGAESRIGKPVPTFALTTVDKKPLANADLANAPATVLNFFAPNCGYCKKQIPRLETIRKTYTEKGVRFVNVVGTMGKEFSQDETASILKELGAGLEVAHDPGNKVGQMFGTSGFPTMVVVGKSGKIEAMNVGNIGDLETRLQGQLDALIAGKPVPAAAAPTAAAQPPAQPPQRPAMQLVGQPAPSFAAIDTFDGKKVSSDDFKNNAATVLNFVAPNCGFCKKQLPNVDPVRAEYEAKGVRFVNMAEKMGSKEFTNEEIIEVFKTAGSRLELAKDADNKIGQLYKAVSFPTMIVVDRGGKIAHVNIGAAQDIDKTLKGQLDALIAGKTPSGTPGGQ